MVYQVTPNGVIADNDCFRNGVVRNRLAYGGVNYGPVNIITESIAPNYGNYGPRPITVEGIVIPTGAVGNHRAPQPECGWITTNEIGVDNGHIFALQLGGPNNSANIVPQWGRWNQNGAWRECERVIYALARALRPVGNRLLWGAYGMAIPGVPATHVMFQIALEYLPVNQYPTITQWGFPRAWWITAYPCDLTGARQGGFIYHNFRVQRALPNNY